MHCFAGFPYQPGIFFSLENILMFFVFVFVYYNNKLLIFVYHRCTSYKELSVSIYIALNCSLICLVYSCMDLLYTIPSRLVMYKLSLVLKNVWLKHYLIAQMKAR